MSAPGSVRAALRRIAADTVSSDRDAVFDDAETGVAQILDRIDRTVLGSTVSFEFDTGARLVCEAVGRRLVRFLPPAPAGLGPEQEALFGNGDLDADQAGAVGAMLVALCTGSRGFRQSAAPLGDGADAPEGGIAPPTVRDALGLAPAGTAADIGEDALETFAAALGSRIEHALVVFDGEITLLRGDEASAAALADWTAVKLEFLLAPDFPLASSLETDGIMVFGNTPAPDRHTVIAGRLGQMLVATIRDDNAAATVEAWRAPRD